jgi:hypothetical protein
MMAKIAAYMSRCRILSFAFRIRYLISEFRVNFRLWRNVNQVCVVQIDVECTM